MINVVRQASLSIRMVWMARALCLGVLCGCGGALLGWGIQHHQTGIAVYGVVVATLAGAVMLLNWRADQ